VDEITLLLWDEQNIAHIANHSVVPSEVEQAVFGGTGLATPARDERRPGAQVVFGETKAGRLLVCFLDRPAAGLSYVLTARPMTRREAADYRAATAKEDDE
jgi:uncharacterized DUF497 family protein